MSKIFAKLKFVKAKDLLSILQMLLVLPFALIAKIFIRNFWLVCEDKNEARDNGYWFFKYVCEHEPNQKIAYAINKKSPDFENVKKLGKVVNYGGFAHWFWYIVADKNISSQKGGKPNAAVCYLFEVVFKLRKNNRIFLQHGITINNVKFLHYKDSYLRLFIAATVDEYNYVVKNFGYPKNYVQLLGFSRFDNLNNELLDKDTILLMPTWRQWIAKGVETKAIEGSGAFEETNYFKKWSEFLASHKLHKLLEDNGKKLLFYPHRNMQPFLDSFKVDNKNIIVCDWKNNDIQQVLKRASLMITDYSSVFFDFVYMKKPVIFYQFDKQEFRAHQYEEGYFNYENNKISDWSDNLDGVLELLEKSIQNNFKVKDENAFNKYFSTTDTKNSERIYNAIKNLKK